MKIPRCRVAQLAATLTCFSRRAIPLPGLDGFTARQIGEFEYRVSAPEAQRTA